MVKLQANINTHHRPIRCVECDSLVKYGEDYYASEKDRLCSIGCANVYFQDDVSMVRVSKQERLVE